MTTTVYTAGYTGKTPQELRALAVALDATVFDIRFSPRSRVPEWNKEPLQRALGDRYRHVPALGNRNYRGDLGEDVNLAKPEEGIRQVLAHPQPVLLLCVCSGFHHCHRRNVAALLAAEGIETQEITCWSRTPPTTHENRSGSSQGTPGGKTGHLRDTIEPTLFGFLEGLEGDEDR
jgi:uncharacterized protein (DUF488 family)